jgi:hypothetical protein
MSGAALRTNVVQIAGSVIVVAVGSFTVRCFRAPIALPSSDLPCEAVWFNQHCLPRGRSSWFVVVTPSLRRSKPPHVFPTSRRRPLGCRRFQVRKGRVVVLHPVLWVVGGGFVSFRFQAVLLRVGELGFF